MQIVFVHGWSVTHTKTYGDLPAWLAGQPGYAVKDVFLGKYISFVDAVTLDDLARAFDQALKDALGPSLPDGFACITHSTGGPVVRLWMQLYYEGRLDKCPLKHLVMLAPANHGSTLAQLGKSVVARLKGWTEGVEPGTRILDWLELGSAGSWELNEAWLKYDGTDAGFYPFVLTGQSIDRKLYDQLNSYTGERGSDGVVRAASANMNYSLVRLRQRGDSLEPLSVCRRPRTAFGILPRLSHTNGRMGILGSVTRANASTHSTPKWVRRCLEVRSRGEYAMLCDELDQLTRQTQKDERVEEEAKLFGVKKYRTSRYAMVVFRFIDDRGDALADYDLYITGGPNYDPDDLPPGFFVDRQRNRRQPGKLTYYLDCDVLRRGLNNSAMGGRLGFRVVARPEAGPAALAFYRPLDFRSDEDAVSGILRPNETLMVEIQLQRCVDARVFRIENTTKPSEIERGPLGRVVDQGGNGRHA